MAIAKRTARLVAQGLCEGIEEALGWPDAWQVRRGANWLLTREGERIALRRVGSDPTRTSTETMHFPDPSGDARGYATPTPDGSSVIICGDREITALAADGTVRWTYPHDSWSSDGSGRGACASTPSGEYVVAVIPGPLGANGSYDGDLCIVLDIADGTLISQTALTAMSAIYEIRQPLAGRDILLLSAGQGQDDAMSYLVSFNQGTLRILPAGAEDEPISGINAHGTELLKMERAGDSLTRYGISDEFACTSEATAFVKNLPGVSDEDRFIGRPGFIDESAVIAALAEDEWSEESRHFLLDARSLEASAELEYPFPVGPDPIALGDGTWLTASSDEIFRWTIETP